MFAVLGVLLGLFLCGAGVMVGERFGPITQWGIVAFGAGIILITAILTAITKLYRKTTANEAFVRTGMGKAKVVLDGGAFVVPILHRLVPVSLETMRLNVDRRGQDALITADNLRVDIAAEFFIKVQARAEDILNAARSLGDRCVSEESIRELVMEKFISALRTVAATKTLIELHTKRDEFAAAVQQIVTADLQENGLTLESVTISSLDQTPLDFLKDDNIFDAQGKRRITETTQQQRVLRNEIQRNAERDVTQKDVMTRKEVLELDRDREFAEATQARDVANVQAERKREEDEFAIQQDRGVELARVAKEKDVQEASIGRDRDVSVAQAQREEAELIAQIVRDKAQQEANVDREKAVEVAGRQAEIAVAEQETVRAETQAQTRAAEARREEEAQRILTVQVTMEAERKAEQKMIAERQEVDIVRYQEQIEADVKAYTVVKVAEGELEAADKQKQAMLLHAEGESESAKRIAEGNRAKEMVPVQVDREKVDVEAARVEVRRQDLENQENFSRAALDFELKKEQIDANKAVQVEMANAVSRMISSADMKLFGDPSTLTQMTDHFMKSVGWGLAVEGLMDSTPAKVQETVQDLIAGTGNALSKALRKFGGKGDEVDPDQLERIVAEAIAKVQAEKEAGASASEAEDAEQAQS